MGSATTTSTTTTSEKESAIHRSFRPTSSARVTSQENARDLLEQAGVGDTSVLESGESLSLSTTRSGNANTNTRHWWPRVPKIKYYSIILTTK
ncbi:hypothetical protein E2C01_030177 [Portunus trituberculatus]|uniref:Uncharacterized protein n=1 Tax=Portunus trituberculatus TaxID=210409 RepID=A0A5B7EUN1_PORTR|nr:hypothetical protein [Portunus trituberculatus]